MALASSASLNKDASRPQQDRKEIPGLINESEEQGKKFMQARDEICESEKSQPKMEDRLESLPREVEYFGKEKKLLKDLTAHTQSLENEVNRLERELGSASAEAEIREIEAKKAQEEEATLMKQVERLKMESQIQICHLQTEAMNEIFEREKEILTLKRELEESSAKITEMEKKILELERMAEGREYGVWRGMKFPWPSAALAGTVVAAAMIFISCAKQRRQMKG